MTVITALPAATILLIISIPRLDKTSLWVDEASSLAATRNLWSTISHTAGTMALFYALLTPWSYVSHEYWWLRLLPLLFSVITLFIVANICTRVASPMAAAYATLLLALTPIYQVQAVELRSYSLEGLCLAGILFLVVSSEEHSARAPAGVQKDTRRRWHWVSFLGGVAVLVHGIAAIYMIAIGVWALIDLLRRESSGSPMYDRILPILSCLPAIIVAAIMWAIGSSTIGDGSAVTIQSLRKLSREFAGQGAVGYIYLISAAAITVSIILIYIRNDQVRIAEMFGVGNRRALRLMMFFTVLPAIGILVVSMTFRSYLAGRYLFPSLIGFVVIVAMALAWLSKVLSLRIRSRVSNIAVAILLGGVISMPILSLTWGHAQAESMQPGRSEDWRGAVELVSRRSQPGDAIIFLGSRPRVQAGSWVPFQAAWLENSGSRAPTALFPKRAFGWPKRFVQYPSVAVTAEQLSEFNRVWVVSFMPQLVRGELQDLRENMDGTELTLILDSRKDFGEANVKLYSIKGGG